MRRWFAPKISTILVTGSPNFVHEDQQRASRSLATIQEEAPSPPKNSALEYSYHR